MTFWNVIAAAAAIVSIISVSGFTLQRGRVEGLRTDLGDARGKIAEQRSEIDDLKRERVEDKATINQQSRDIAVLQRVVTGEVHWQAISDLLDHHHDLAERHWLNTEQTMNEILEAIRGAA